MQSRVHLQIEPARREAARAVYVQLKAAAGDVADGSEWKLAEHRATVTPRGLESPYVSSDSTLRHAGAQQCMQRRRYAAATTVTVVMSSASAVSGRVSATVREAARRSGGYGQ
jgi:hypothetical protein